MRNQSTPEKPFQQFIGDGFLSIYLVFLLSFTIKGVIAFDHKALLLKMCSCQK